jgi:serine/threonine protein kinase
MTTSPESRYYDAVMAALGHRYHLEHMVALSPERALFLATDKMLRRRVSLRVQDDPESPTRAWFLREAETLARLDHHAIRHVYDAGVIGPLAFRIGNWIDGESLFDAVERAPRPIPVVHGLARDILSALQHAHERGIVARRITPDAILINTVGRSTVTDLRFASPNLDVIPAGIVPSDLAFMAPEVRDGQTGDPASDVYTAGALLYYAVTGEVPPLDPRELVSPSELRPVCPRVVTQILIRALQAAPEDRYFSTGEMLEHFAAEAGAFDVAWTRATPLPGELMAIEDPTVWEHRLRRALGDDYELLDLLGAGGFGRVYRVRDLHLEREVALKVLHPSMTTDPSGVERFRREAQLAAGLQHPNVVNIFDIASRSGLMWYTMALVNGPNLAQLVERDGPLPLEGLLRILREALSAMSHAHASGLIHRDIKPENMLLERDGSLRITDFGLALALRGQGVFGGATSRSGTPQFASPEQLLGEPVDQRTDIYSVAAVAYYGLLGYPPFAGATPEQVLAKQMNNQIPSLRPERPDVSPELEQVLRRALHSDPERRYPSAAEFYQAIHQAERSRRSEPAGTNKWPLVPASWWRRQGK